MTACGGTGVVKNAGCGLCGAKADVRGAISSLNGSQSKMEGWVVAAFEEDTSIARVAEVNDAGLFTLRQVRSSEPHTLALFSPDYILMSVLSIPANNNKTIRQFFKMKKSHLPKLIHEGPIVTMENFIGVDVTNHLASDKNGDGIPDGAKSYANVDNSLRLKGRSGDTVSTRPTFTTSSPSFALGGSSIDTDNDGIPNEKDTDIDGDGVINVLDSDDNGNGTLDVFDRDANGNLKKDTGPDDRNTDQYFKEGVEYVGAQFEMRPKDDGSGTQTSLKFITKVRDNVNPNAVQVRGAPSLLNGAVYQKKDDTGEAQNVAWNRLLKDDGESEDSNPEDRIYGQKVVLKNAKKPRAHETVFFQLAFGDKSNPWFAEFPFTFPPLNPQSIQSQYDPNTRTVMLRGTPFGKHQEYLWSIDVYDKNGKVVWTSKSIEGSTRQYKIAANALDPTESDYKYTVIAQTLGKVPSLPTYTIYSKKYDLK